MKKDFEKEKDGNLSTSLEARESQNCWEFWGCAEEAKKECVVFLNHMGRECWFVSQIIKEKIQKQKNIEIVLNAHGIKK